MYGGITCGKLFAFKHFLSGNRFKLSTWIFKSSSISKKILNDKIKCLHLFQCLVESNNKDIIESVNQFFQNNQIDLSNQTLLPNDVNTLGFFLMRSVNKQWEMLDLSGCTIRSIGINILCDRFLNKGNRQIAVIKKVDFSYNQLKFSSLIQILDLLKSWRTHQLIIKDSMIHRYYFSVDVYNSIEETFHLSINDKPIGMEIGLFLFCHKISMFTNIVTAKSIYLLNCDLITAFPEVKLVANLSKIHLINTSLPGKLLKEICLHILLLENDKATLYLCNPELSDQDAEDVCSLIISSKMTNRIILIINNSKIQGTISTSTVSEQLIRSEILANRYVTGSAKTLHVRVFYTSSQKRL